MVAKKLRIKRKTKTKRNGVLYARHFFSRRGYNGGPTETESVVLLS